MNRMVLSLGTYCATISNDVLHEVHFHCGLYARMNGVVNSIGSIYISNDRFIINDLQDMNKFKMKLKINLGNYNTWITYYDNKTIHSWYSFDDETIIVEDYI